MAERDPGPGSEDGGAAPGTGLAGFLEELRRRRVFRALVGYAIFAFAVLQVIEPVLHGLHLPDGLLTVVVVGLGAGLPITVLVSWAYDLKGTSLVRTPGPAGRSPWLLGGLLAIGALLGAGAAWGALHHAQPEARRGADGRVLVAVADFANDTRDPELDGLSGLLITSLEQSKALRVLTRGRMLELLRAAGRSGVEQIDEAAAREIGRQVGATALLHASIRLLGGAYLVDLRAVDPARDDYLFTLRETAAGKGEVLALVDRLSAATRRRLRDDATSAGNAVRVGDVVTNDLEAYQHFFRGDQHLEAARVQQALEEYGKALEADPDFALAHLRIAWLGPAAGMPRAARVAHIDAAVRNIGRAPAREALFIRAMKALEDGHLAEAEALADEAVQSFPESKEALFFASGFRSEQLRWAEAVPLLERAVALDPTWPPAVASLCDMLSLLGRFDEAAARARAWAERAPSALAFQQLAQALGGSGQPLRAVAAARRALELEDSLLNGLYLAEALIMADRPEEAEAVLRGLLRPGALYLVRSQGTFRLAGALSAQGRLREAFEVASSIPPGPDGETDLRDWALLMLHMCGEPSAEGRRLAASLARSDMATPQEFAPFHLLLHGDEAGAAAAAARIGPKREGRAHYEATLAWRHGDRERALAILQEAARAGGRFMAGLQWQIARYASALGRDAEVIAAADALARMPSGTWRGLGFAQALYQAAVAHQRRGEPARAVERLDRLLALWRRADPDLPLLKDARALRGRLGSPN